MKLLFIVAAIALSSSLFAQSATTLDKVYIGKSHLIHLVGSSGKDTTMPKEKGQVDVSAPKLSTDKQTAGWLIHEDNCCTSYSIPTRLLIFRADKKLRLGDGLMIYDWCFVDGSARVAVSTGTVHGMVDRHLLLYDASSGQQLQEWNGKDDEAPPPWAKDLEA